MAKHPTIAREQRLLERLRAAGINTDITDRWNRGVEHRVESVELGAEIAALDWMLLDDSFGFKFGGDGDNGEQLLYLLDVLFDLKASEDVV